MPNASLPPGILECRTLISRHNSCSTWLHVGAVVITRHGPSVMKSRTAVAATAVLPTPWHERTATRLFLRSALRISCCLLHGSKPKRFLAFHTGSAILARRRAVSTLSDSSLIWFDDYFALNLKCRASLLQRNLRKLHKRHDLRPSLHLNRLILNKPERAF